MASLSSFLWLLSLMACFCNSQRIKIRMTSAPTQISQVMELECDSSSADAGIHWIYQNMDHNPRYIVYITSRGRTTPEQQVDVSATKLGSTYKLTMKNFKVENQGIYYCAAHQNQILIFSPGQQVYLPVTTTTPTTTTRRSTTPPQATNKELMGQDLSNSEKELSGNSLNFSCALYIFIPLTCSCLLLLIILVITLYISCDPRRRRRTCRCHRPMNGINGKHGLPHLPSGLPH